MLTRKKNQLVNVTESKSPPVGPVVKAVSSAQKTETPVKKTVGPAMTPDSSPFALQRKEDLSRLAPQDRYNLVVHGDKPTGAQALAKIYKVAGNDHVLRDALLTQFEQERSTLGSPISNPYTVPTGKGSAARANSVRLNSEKELWGKTIAHYAKKGYSDAEIQAKFDPEKYPTLAQADLGRKTGKPLPLAEPTDYDEDFVTGIAWATRNGGGTGSHQVDAIKSYLGDGNIPLPNNRQANYRNPKSPDYRPYKWGTDDDLCTKIGVDHIDQHWVNENRNAAFAAGADSDLYQNWESAYIAVKRTEASQAELADLTAIADARMETTDDPVQVLQGLKEQYPHLAQMDLGRSMGKPVVLTEPVDYRWEDFQRDIINKCRAKKFQRTGKTDTDLWHAPLMYNNQHQFSQTPVASGITPAQTANGQGATGIPSQAASVPVLRDAGKGDTSQGTTASDSPTASISTQPAPAPPLVQQEAVLKARPAGFSDDQKSELNSLLAEYTATVHDPSTNVVGPRRTYDLVRKINDLYADAGVESPFSVCSQDETEELLMKVYAPDGTMTEAQRKAADTIYAENIIFFSDGYEQELGDTAAKFKALAYNHLIGKDDKVKALSQLCTDYKEACDSGLSLEAYYDAHPEQKQEYEWLENNVKAAEVTQKENEKQQAAQNRHNDVLFIQKMGAKLANGGTLTENEQKIMQGLENTPLTDADKQDPEYQKLWNELCDLKDDVTYKVGDNALKLESPDIYQDELYHAAMNGLDDLFGVAKACGYSDWNAYIKENPSAAISADTLWEKAKIAVEEKWNLNGGNDLGAWLFGNDFTAAQGNPGMNLVDVVQYGAGTGALSVLQGYLDFAEMYLTNKDPEWINKLNTSYAISQYGFADSVSGFNKEVQYQISQLDDGDMQKSWQVILDQSGDATQIGFDINDIGLLDGIQENKDRMEDNDKFLRDHGTPLQIALYQITSSVMKESLLYAGKAVTGTLFVSPLFGTFMTYGLTNAGETSADASSKGVNRSGAQLIGIANGLFTTWIEKGKPKAAYDEIGPIGKGISNHIAAQVCDSGIHGIRKVFQVVKDGGIQIIKAAGEYAKNRLKDGLQEGVEAVANDLFTAFGSMMDGATDKLELNLDQTFDAAMHDAVMAMIVSTVLSPIEIVHDTAETIADSRKQRAATRQIKSTENDQLISIADAQPQNAVNAQALSTTDSQSQSATNGQALSLPKGQTQIVQDAQPQNAVNAQAFSTTDSHAQSAADSQALSVPKGQTQTAQDAQPQNAVNAQALSTTDSQAQSATDGQALSVPKGQTQTVQDAQPQNALNAQALSTTDGQTQNASDSQTQSATDGQALSVAKGQTQIAQDAQPQNAVNAQAFSTTDGQAQSAADGQALSVLKGQTQIVQDAQPQNAVNAQALSTTDSQAQNATNSQALSVPKEQTQIAQDAQLQNAVNAQALSTSDGQTQSAADPSSLDVATLQAQNAANRWVADAANEWALRRLQKIARSYVNDPAKQAKIIDALSAQAMVNAVAKGAMNTAELKAFGEASYNATQKSQKAQQTYAVAQEQLNQARESLTAAQTNLIQNPSPENAQAFDQACREAEAAFYENNKAQDVAAAAQQEAKKTDYALKKAQKEQYQHIQKQINTQVRERVQSQIDNMKLDQVAEERLDQKQSFVPYTGETPFQPTAAQSEPVAVSDQAYRQVNRIVTNAQNKTGGGKGARLSVQKALESKFGNALRGIKVEIAGATVQGKPYRVKVDAHLLEKVVSDPALSAETLSVLDSLESVIESANYESSSGVTKAYAQRTNIIRYDHFTCPVVVNGKRMQAQLLIAVVSHPDRANTCKLSDIDLTRSPRSGTPSASNRTGATANGSDPSFLMDSATPSYPNQPATEPYPRAAQANPMQANPSAQTGNGNTGLSGNPTSPRANRFPLRLKPSGSKGKRQFMK